MDNLIKEILYKEYCGRKVIYKENVYKITIEQIKLYNLQAPKSTSQLLRPTLELSQIISFGFNFDRNYFKIIKNSWNV